MSPARPEFVPDPALSRNAMESMQREIAAAARFDDDRSVPTSAVSVDRPLETEAGPTQDWIDDGDAGPVVAGVDQAFVDDRALSVIVAVRGSAVIECVHAVEPLSIPYIPGLLSFREGGPILAAFEQLNVEPDVVLFDGSGRIHFREAGIATHIGVVLDVPSVGVAKSLLCGQPRTSVDELPAGDRVPIEADDRVEAEPGTVLGHAVQTRQFDDARRVNPVYVSPGHRVSADTAATLVGQCCAGYKLPEPIRLADRLAGDRRNDLG